MSRCVQAVSETITDHMCRKSDLGLKS